MAPFSGKQKTSFWADLKRRPHIFWQDFKESAPLKFATGNVLYSLFLLLQTGLNFGSAVATGLHSTITAITIKRQAGATHTGTNFDAPYRAQGWANMATAAALGLTGLYNYETNSEKVEEALIGLAPDQDWADGLIELLPEPTSDNDDWERMVFPSVTFFAWGCAHFVFGAAANRKRKLKAQGQKDPLINTDLEIKASYRKGEIASGVADVAAIFKDKSLEEAANMLEKPLEPQNFNSISGLPFFLVGFYKSVHKGPTPFIGRHIDALQTKFLDTAPQKLKAALHLENQKITPVHTYAAGYTATGIISGFAAVSNPVHAVFAVTSLTWGAGYHDMTRETTRPPESADAYALRMGYEA